MKSELLVRVRSWHNRAIEEEDYFVKFIFDYLAFIALICYNKDKRDRKLIQELKRDPQVKKEYFSKVNMDKLNEIIPILHSRPITNETNEHDKWWDCDLNHCPQQVSSTDGIIHSVDDFQNIIEFVYRARNNLFHGRKGIDFGRDSLIVEYGFHLINPLVDVLIDLKGN